VGNLGVWKVIKEQIASQGRWKAILEVSNNGGGLEIEEIEDIYR